MGKLADTNNRTIVYVVERLFTLLSTIVRWGAIVLIAIEIRKAIEALSGKQTAIDLILTYLAETGSGITVSISIIVTVTAIVFARRERKLRYAVINRLTSRTSQLEKQIDPGRTTSNLTPEGKTNPRDS